MDFPPFVMVYHKQTKSPIHAEPIHISLGVFVFRKSVFNNIPCSQINDNGTAPPHQQDKEGIERTAW